MSAGAAALKLRELGFAFNDAGELREIDKNTGALTDKPFQFDVYNGDIQKNQARYEELADQIPEIVYDLLEKEGLNRVYIPKELPREEATFVFTYPERLQKPKKLLLLIHGSGYVRAGQWARSLIINNSLDHGTQLPYIRRAKELGYSLIVLNTNDNIRNIDGVNLEIPGAEDAITHAKYVFRNLVLPAEPESVAIVAHSYGGGVTFMLVKEFQQFFEQHCSAIALTDSTHCFAPKEVTKKFKSICCNWVACSKTSGTPLKSADGDVKIVSAGHSKHEWTSYTAFESVFQFLEEKYAEFIERNNEHKRRKLDN